MPKDDIVFSSLVVLALFLAGCSNNGVSPPHDADPDSGSSQISVEWSDAEQRPHVSIVSSTMKNEATAIFIPFANSTNYSIDVRGRFVVTDPGPCESGTYVAPVIPVGKFRPGSSYFDVPYGPLVLPNEAESVHLNFTASGGVGTAAEYGGTIFGVLIGAGSCSPGSLRLEIQFNQGSLHADSNYTILKGNLSVFENQMTTGIGALRVPLVAYENSLEIPVSSSMLSHVIFPTPFIEASLRSVQIEAPGMQGVDMTGYSYPGAQSGFLKSYTAFLEESGKIKVTYTGIEPTFEMSVISATIEFHTPVPGSELLSVPFLER